MGAAWCSGEGDGSGGNAPTPFEVELTVQGCLVGVMRGEAVVAWATGAV